MLDFLSVCVAKSSLPPILALSVVEVGREAVSTTFLSVCMMNLPWGFPLGEAIQRNLYTG